MARRAIDTMNRLAKDGKLDAAMGRRPSGQGETQIALDKIVRDEEQPRKKFDEAKLQELASSIKEHGVLQAITVQPANADGVHLIIMGERRWRAAKLAGLASIPVVIKDATAELRAIQLVENIQREELTTMEVARAVEQMKMEGKSRSDIAKILGWSETQISLFGKVSKMPPKLQELAEASVQVRALSDLNSLWDKDQEAVTLFVGETRPEDINRITVSELKSQIDGKGQTSEQEVDTEVVLPARPKEAIKSQVAATSANAQLVFFCEQDGAIGRLVTEKPASSSKKVLVSFDNGDRVEEISLEDIKLHEAVVV